MIGEQQVGALVGGGAPREADREHVGVHARVGFEIDIVKQALFLPSRAPARSPAWECSTRSASCNCPGASREYNDHRAVAKGSAVQVAA